ncbi:MAG: DUF3800 domain-containing protein [Eubacteriales bacterium]|jgi:hypothetical protein
MNIYIYSDESGVLDKIHNKYFTFAGLIFLSKEKRDVCSRKYINAENVIRKSESLPPTKEVRSTTISNKSKGKLFRSLNQIQKFGVVIRQEKLLDSVLQHKKTKQRYLDWVYKIAVKSKLEQLISQGCIEPNCVERIFFYIDEHTTATDGIYELKESLEQEFRFGMHNYKYMIYYPPLFPNLLDIKVIYCNSSTNTLIRGADIVANQLYYMAKTNDFEKADGRNFHVIFHP